MVRIHRRGRGRPGVRDDEGVAGAVGLVLMVAVLVTAYAGAVRTNLPIYGEEAEHHWVEAVAASFADMAGAVADGVEAGAATSATIPKPPTAKTIDLPFLGSAAPIPPSGTVSFEPSCASVTATHTLTSGIVVKDLDSASTGCVAFVSVPVYSLPVTYHYELGGVVRTDGVRSVVVAGPLLTLDAVSPAEIRVAWSTAGLRGDAVGISAEAADVHVDIQPGATAPEVEQAPNAARVTWTIDTAHPAAWKTWYESRFTQAGFVASRTSPPSGVSSADYSVACSPADCSTPGGRGRVVVEIEGPRTDTADVKLSITYGLADATLR